LLVLLAGYLLGSVPTGLLVVRWAKGVDVRRYGSGNIGTVNVLRVAGTGAALLVFAVDALKGVLAVGIAGWAGASPAVTAAAGLASIVGHDWSVFLGFKGGKGVATTFGVILGLSPAAASISVAAWVALVALTRYASVGSMLGAVSVPIVLYFLREPLEYVVLGAAISVLTVYAHRANVRRLLSGEELKVNQSVTPEREGKDAR